MSEIACTESRRTFPLGFWQTARDIRDRVHADHPGWLCRSGCAECCKEEIIVGRKEWEPIRAAFLALDETAQHAIIRAAHRYARRQGNGDCPFLERHTRTCQVYDARPSCCRFFGYGFYDCTPQQRARLGHLVRDPGTRQFYGCLKLKQWALKHTRDYPLPNLTNLLRTIVDYDDEFDTLVAWLLREFAGESR
jgi:hypothetical protein